MTAPPDPFHALFALSPSSLAAKYGFPGHTPPVPSLRMFGARRLVIERHGVEAARAIDALWNPKAWAGDKPPAMPTFVTSASASRSAAKPTPQPTAAPSRKTSTPKAAPKAEKKHATVKKPKTPSAAELRARINELRASGPDRGTLLALEEAERALLAIENPEAARRAAAEERATLARMDRAFGHGPKRPLVERQGARTVFHATANRRS